MNKYKTLTKTSKNLVIITSAFLLYGYLCRVLGIYFFWESKMVGWILVFAAAISLLNERIQFKKSQNNKTTSEYVCIGLIVLVLLGLGSIYFAFPRTDAYTIAKQYLLTDESVSGEVGEVKSVVLLPTGSISITTVSEEKTGQAEFNFIVKGETKFKDFNLHLVKKADTDWTIIKTN